MIIIKQYFTSIYLYFYTCVYVLDIIVYESSMGLLYSVNLQSTGLLLLCTYVLQGDTYIWLWLYNLTGWRTAPVTAVIRENPVALRNPVLQSLPVNSGFWVPPTHSCGEAMEYFIIALVDSAYDLYRTLVLHVCTSFVSETPVVLTTYSQVIYSS